MRHLPCAPPPPPPGGRPNRHHPPQFRLETSRSLGPDQFAPIPSLGRGRDVSLSKHLDAVVGYASRFDGVHEEVVDSGFKV